MEHYTLSMVVEVLPPIYDQSYIRGGGTSTAPTFDRANFLTFYLCKCGAYATWGGEVGAGAGAGAGAIQERTGFGEASKNATHFLTPVPCG